MRVVEQEEISSNNLRTVENMEVHDEDQDIELDFTMNSNASVDKLVDHPVISNELEKVTSVGGRGEQHRLISKEAIKLLMLTLATTFKIFLSGVFTSWSC